MTAKALGDGTLGVNAQIAALTLDSTVAGVPDTRPPDVVSVKNQADHNVTVDESAGDDQYPLIVVCITDKWRGPGMVWTSVQDFSGDVDVVYVTRGGSAAKNFIDTDYTLRAMKKAIHAYLLTPSTRDANARRNSIAIKNSPDISYGHAEGSFMGGQVSGLLKLTFDARDLNP